MNELCYNLDYDITQSFFFFFFWNLLFVCARSSRSTRVDGKSNDTASSRESEKCRQETKKRVDEGRE